PAHPSAKVWIRVRGGGPGPPPAGGGKGHRKPPDAAGANSLKPPRAITLMPDPIAARALNPCQGADHVHPDRADAESGGAEVPAGANRPLPRPARYPRPGGRRAIP